MHFLVFTLAAALLKATALKKLLDVKPHFRSVQLLDDLKVKSAPKLIDFISTPNFDAPIPKVANDDEFNETDD